jgi:hypothetical protein
MKIKDFEKVSFEEMVLRYNDGNMVNKKGVKAFEGYKWD